MIQISNLHKRFGQLTVLDGLDLEIRKGGIFAILGPNGSGKTTLIKCLLGMVIPTRGTIHLNGDPILGKYQYRNSIGYLPQIANFPGNLKVRELIRMLCEIRPNASYPDQLLEDFGLNQVLDQKLGVLSGGTKQKVNLVLTFMFDSPLIILDEPTNGLDPVALIFLKKLIQREKDAGKTILVTSHIMSFVEEVSDEIVFLLEGNIYFKGTVAAIRKQTGQKNLENAIAKLMADE